MSETPNDPREPDRPQSDEAGDTAYAAVPPPLPPTGDPAQGPVQDAIPGASEQPQSGFAAPGDQPPHQQSPYQQQPPQQQPQYQQYPGGGQYAGQQQTQFGAPGPYQAAPPPPGYGQPYGYPTSDLPPGIPPLADWGQRATAFILDNGIAVVAGWIAGADINHTVDTTLGIIGLVGVIWAIINAVRAGREGQSYGKKVMGIRLARLADGQPIGGGLGFLRLFLNWILWVACVIPGVLNLLWPLWDSKNQTWSDKVAKSVVVKTR